MNAQNPAQSTRSLTDLITRRSATGPVLQELTSISNSIPWLRAQRYWELAGVQVFTSGEVPYAATSDGKHSMKALELYLTSLRSAEGTPVEATSYVLELGVGSGVFAKLFLDQLRRDNLSEYERTTYLVCDRSPTLLEDTRRSGVFADHEERIVRVQLTSESLADTLTRVCPQALGGIRAVHANYVLDSLAFTIVSAYERGLFELRVRTRLRDHVVPPTYPPPPSDDMVALEAWLEQLGHHKPASHHHALAYESEYVRVDRETLPHSDLIPTFQQSACSQQMVHSFGAIDCLQETLGVVRTDGYLLCLDYSYNEAQTDPIEFQCFGASVSSGVNFSQLMAAAQRLPGVTARAPATDPASIQARIFTRHQAPPELLDRFSALYDKQAWESIEAPYHEAMKLVQVGQFEAARWKLEEAHRLQPNNWSMMETTVAFLIYTVSDFEAGLEVAKRGLQLNHLSPRLWNLLGDAYYSLNAMEDAERAYCQAIQVNPSDVRARANLAYVSLRRGDPPGALRIIGEALALDSSGAVRDELLAKQSEALRELANLHLRDSIGNINRLQGHHSLPHRLLQQRSI